MCEHTVAFPAHGTCFAAFVAGVLPPAEVHKSVTQRQASMMFKLVTARAINSAFLLFIITSDTEQFEADTLTKVRWH